MLLFLVFIFVEIIPSYTLVCWLFSRGTLDTRACGLWLSETFWSTYILDPPTRNTLFPVSPEIMFTNKNWAYYNNNNNKNMGKLSLSANKGPKDLSVVMCVCVHRHACICRSVMACLGWKVKLDISSPKSLLFMVLSEHPKAILETEWVL